MSNEYERRLAYAARRAVQQREFLAWALARYSQQERWDEKELMEFLKCPDEAFYRLALCRAPTLEASDFRQRVERVAASVGASASRLAHVLREVAHMDALPVEPVAQLMAAREREDADVQKSIDKKEPGKETP